MRLRTTASLVLAALGTFSSAIYGANPSLTVHVDQTKAKIPATLYGLMTEEINYSYDGGLYGELIRNRVFKDNANEPTHWTLTQPEGAGTKIALDKTDPAAPALDTSLKLDASALKPGQTASLANDGFWGIPVRPGTTYTASFYIKNSNSAPVTVSIQSNDGAATYAQSRVTAGPAWSKVSVTLATDANVKPTKDAKFVIAVSDPTVISLSLVSLFPPTYNNRPNGNRVDLMQMLVDMKPAFLRFPGGNYLEGDTIEDRFDWKKTLGDLSTRPGHQGPWRYRSSDGMGLLEFMHWIEDMKAEPILCVFAGYALKGAYVEPGPKLQPFVDEALEEIEYLTGDASTKWGARRIADGHPAPFKLRYVEVGNEDWFDKSGSYDGRFAQFYDAIKAKYPDLQIIATTKVTSRVADLLDEHYYFSNIHDAQAAAHKYDVRPRDQKTKIFVGEWATRVGYPTTNLESALADAAFMTGFERNADIVLMSCYAPLFVNVNPGGMQWRSDLIGYDALTSFGSPSYYAQKIFNTHLGDVVPVSEITGVPTAVPPPLPPRRPASRPTSQQAGAPQSSSQPAPRPRPPVDQIYYSITKSSATNTLYLKVVNVSDTVQPLDINFEGATSLSPQAKVVTIAGTSGTDTNSITEPEKIVPVASSITTVSPHFTHSFPAFSITVMQIEQK